MRHDPGRPSHTESTESFEVRLVGRETRRPIQPTLPNPDRMGSGWESDLTTEDGAAVGVEVEAEASWELH